MKATEVLMNEHRVIEQVLGCLEAMANQAEGTGTLDGESAVQAVDFFRNFADRCHHGKEEDHLFPMLESRGLVRDGGPTGVMLHEHELGRKLLAEMSTAIQDRSALDFLPPARAYIHLLREHIWKEDHRLFRMADQILNREDEAQLMQAFETTEHEDMGDGTHENYLRLANHLADRFGVKRSGAPIPCGRCSHFSSDTIRTTTP